MNYLKYSAILNSKNNTFNIILKNSYSKKTTYPYTPAIKDLRINKITKVVDQDLTSENANFLKKLIGIKEVNLVSPLKESPWPKHDWFPGVKRTGVLAKKIGQFPQWRSNGRKFFVTLLQVHDNHVVDYKSPEIFSKSLTCKPYWKGKYGCITIGCQSSDPRMFNPAYLRLFEKSGLTNAPKAKISRFIINPEAAIQPGTPISVNHFKVGHYVDCEARTIEHGFQGVIKRWGFKGCGKGRGNTKNHRRPGSFGGGKRGDRKSPGTVHKGTRMPGLMGGRTRVQRGLQVWRINTKHNVLYVHGFAIPGPINGYVKVFDTRIYRKSPLKKEDAPPFPTSYPEDSEVKEMPEDMSHQELHNFINPSITFKDKSTA